MNAAQKRCIFFVTFVSLFVGACGGDEVPFDEQPRHEFEEPENCERVEGVTEASDAGKAEDVAQVGYRVERNSARIEFDAIGRNGDVIGTGATVFDIADKKLVSTTTFIDDSGTAEEVTTTQFFDGLMAHKTINRVNDNETFLLWTQGVDGRLIDASAGILTALEADGEQVFSLPEGNVALLQFVKAGEQIKTSVEIEAFVREFGLIVLDDSQAFRRMKAIANDVGWQTAMNLQILVCQGYVASTFAGPVECEPSDPLGFVTGVSNPVSAGINGNKISDAINENGGVAGLRTLALASAATFIADAIISEVVKRNADAAAPIVYELGTLINRNIPAGDLTVGRILAAAAAALSIGEPHLTTFDGLRFDLQSAGELVLARSLAGDFEVQSRQVPYGSSVCGDLAVNGAFALRIGQTRLMYEVGADIPLSVNGTPITPFTTPIEIGEGIFVVESEAGHPIIASPTGETVYLAGRAIYIVDAQDRAGQYEGLLGNANGNPDDDFVSAQGALPMPISWNDIHGQFVDHWRVNADTSLFTYEAGESHETFFLENYPDGPATIGDLPEEQREEAELACAEIENEIAFRDCVFDVGCTGDESFVEDHLIGEPSASANVLYSIDFNDWTVEGAPDDGNWELNETSDGVIQTINGNPTFFVSSDNYFNQRVNGTITIAAGDDDLVGFVFGYQPQLSETQLQSYVLTWKATAQDVAPEGLRLLYVDGDYGGEIDPYFWDVTDPGVTLVAEDIGLGTGWRRNTDHRFSLLYTADGIEVWIDGEKRIDAPAANLPVPPSSGRFGFFNYSQASTEYAQFSVGAPSAEPLRENCLKRVGQVGVRVLEGEYNWGVTCSRLALESEVRVPAGVTLNIHAGTSIVANDNAGFTVLEGGTLSILGTQAEKVTFRGASNTAGSWSGFVTSGTTDIAFAEISHAGRTGHTFSVEDESSLTISNSLIQQSNGTAIVASDDVQLNISNTRILQIEQASLTMPFSSIVGLSGTGNVFEQGVSLQVATGDAATLRADASLTDWGAPYVLEGGDEAWITVGTLTLLPGVRLTLPQNLVLTTEDGGALVANGETTRRVRIEGAADTFGALIFDSEAASSLTHVDIIGGGNIVGALGQSTIFVESGSLSMTQCVVRDSAGSAVLVRNGATYVESENTYLNNASGDVIRE